MSVEMEKSSESYWLKRKFFQCKKAVFVEEL